MPPRPIQFAKASLLGADAPHLLCTLNSRHAGWSSLLLLRQQLPPVVERCERPPSPDQHIAMLTRSTQNFEFFSNGRWHATRKRAGDIGVSPPMQTAPHRWRSTDLVPGEMLSIYLPAIYLEEAAEEYRRAGLRTPTLFPTRTVFEDPTLVQLLFSLARAAEQGQPDTYAGSAARFLATHLLALANHWTAEVTSRGIGDDLTDTRLSRVIDFLDDQHRENVSTEDLARVAGISPFHFARLFKRKLGVTPHQYVTRLRMKSAEALLSGSDRSVLEVASACGYSNASHFAAAFFAFFGQSPAVFRETRSSIGRHLPASDDMHRARV